MHACIAIRSVKLAGKRDGSAHDRLYASAVDSRTNKVHHDSLYSLADTLSDELKGFFNDRVEWMHLVGNI
jgi:hypothetical protein